MVLKGIPASPGITIGKAFIYDKEDFWIEERTVAPQEVEREVERFLKAIEEIKGQIKGVRDRIQAELGEEEARIFDAHLMMLDDRVAIDETIARIRNERKNAEFAFFRTLRKAIKTLRSIDDEYLREKMVDIKDIGRRVFFKLCDREHPTLDKLEAQVIVIAHALSPFDIAHMRRDKVLGFATDIGGKTSHIAIMARALEIPAVVGLEQASSQILPDDMLIIDGNQGLVHINPDRKTLRVYREERSRLLGVERDLGVLRDLPAVTLDGKSVEISANIELPDEVDKALAHGARGVGLFRTEFLYLVGQELPTEEEQFETYRSIAEKIAPYPVIIRTLDLGGDKLSSGLHTAPEANPFLGWRAIRVSLMLKDVFKVQLRAILRASLLKNVQIMFPMISGVEELIQAKRVLEEVKEDLRMEEVPFDEGIKVGAMIEVPSAAMVAEQLAEEVDFFSIGTNDLIQYSIAVDRGNEKIAYLFEPFHPGVLRLVKYIIDAGHSKGIWVGMCGEMSGDPLAAIPLLGFGLDEFSMSPILLPRIKNIIRSVTIEEAKVVAEKIMGMRTAEEIKDHLKGVLDQKFCELPAYEREERKKT